MLSSINYRLSTSLLNCLDVIFNIHEEVAKQNYVAIDFYDGSIMYDFDANTTTICDLYNAWEIALETK
jgi:hypothetical protein